MAQVVKCLPNKHKALNSKLQYLKKKKKETTPKHHFIGFNFLPSAIIVSEFCLNGGSVNTGSSAPLTGQTIATS
jgi:hypothetical protein